MHQTRQKHPKIKSQALIKVIIVYKSRGGPFLCSRILYLGWFWAGWHYSKINWADYEQLLRTVFSWFKGQFLFKFFKNIVVSSTKKLHKMDLKKKENLKI